MADECGDAPSAELAMARDALTASYGADEGLSG